VTDRITVTDLAGQEVATVQKFLAKLMRFAGFKSTPNGERNFPQCSRQKNIIYKTSATPKENPRHPSFWKGELEVEYSLEKHSAQLIRWNFKGNAPLLP